MSNFARAVWCANAILVLILLISLSYWFAGSEERAKAAEEYARKQNDATRSLIGKKVTAIRRDGYNDLAIEVEGGGSISARSIKYSLKVEAKESIAKP